MLRFFKKLILFVDLVINHGIRPSTIFSNKNPLKDSIVDKLKEDKNKHCM